MKTLFLLIFLLIGCEKHHDTFLIKYIKGNWTSHQGGLGENVFFFLNFEDSNYSFYLLDDLIVISNSLDLNFSIDEIAGTITVFILDFTEESFNTKVTYLVQKQDRDNMKWIPINSNAASIFWQRL